MSVNELAQYLRDADTGVSPTGETLRFSGFDAPEKGGEHELLARYITEATLAKNPEYKRHGQDRYGRTLVDIPELRKNQLLYGNAATTRWSDEQDGRNVATRSYLRAFDPEGSTVPGYLQDAYGLAALQHDQPLPPTKVKIGYTPGLVDASWERGKANLHVNLGMFGKALGELIGSDAMQDWGYKKAYFAQQRASRYMQRVKNFDEVLDDPSKFLTYVTEAVVENLPNLGVDIATGVATGGGALIAKKLGWGLLKDQLAKDVFSKGMQVGMAGAIYPQMVGETKAQMEHEGIDSTIAPFLTGIAKTGSELYGLNRLVRASGGLLKVPPKTVGEFAARLSKAAGTQFGVEAGTETFQQALDFLTLKAIDSNYDIFTEDNWDELRESFFRGGFAGGGTAAVTGTATGSAGLLLSKGSQQPSPEDSSNEQQQPPGDGDLRDPDSGGRGPTPDSDGTIPDYDSVQNLDDIIREDSERVPDISPETRPGETSDRTVDDKPQPPTTREPTLTQKEEQELRDFAEIHGVELLDEEAEGFQISEESLDDFQARREIQRSNGWVESSRLTETDPEGNQIAQLVPQVVRAKEAIKGILKSANNYKTAVMSLNRKGTSKPWQFSVFETIKLGQALDHADKANYTSDQRNIDTKLGDWLLAGLARLIETGEVSIPDKYEKGVGTGEYKNARMKWVEDAIYEGTKQHPKQNPKKGIFNLPVGQFGGKWFTVSDLLNGQKRMGREATSEELLDPDTTGEEFLTQKDHENDLSLQEQSELEGGDFEDITSSVVSEREAEKRGKGFEETPGGDVKLDYQNPPKIDRSNETQAERIARKIEDITTKTTKTAKAWFPLEEGYKMSMFPAVKDRKGYTVKQVKDFILVEKEKVSAEKSKVKPSAPLRRAVSEILEQFYPGYWNHIRAAGQTLRIKTDKMLKGIVAQGFPENIANTLEPLLQGESDQHLGAYIPGHNAVVIAASRLLQVTLRGKGLQGPLRVERVAGLQDHILRYTYAHELGHHLDSIVGDISYKLTDDEVKTIRQELKDMAEFFGLTRKEINAYRSHISQEDPDRLRQELFANAFSFYHNEDVPGYEQHLTDKHGEKTRTTLGRIIEHAQDKGRTRENTRDVDTSGKPVQGEVREGAPTNRRVPRPATRDTGSDRDGGSSPGGDTAPGRILGSPIRIKALGARLKTSKGLKDAYNIGEKFAKKYLFDSDSALRSIPGGEILANLLHQQTGEKHTGTPLTRAYRTAAAPYQAQIHAIIRQKVKVPTGKAKLNPKAWAEHRAALKEQSKRIHTELTTKPDEELSPQAKEVRDLLDSFREWMNTEDSKIRNAKGGTNVKPIVPRRKNFFPRIYHVHSLDEFGGRFNELLVKYHPGIAMEEANRIRLKLIEHGGTLDTLTELELSELPAGFSHSHQRKIMIPDDVLAKGNFIETDLATALDLYFHRGAKSIEWERLFGGYRTQRVINKDGLSRDIQVWDRSSVIRQEFSKMRKAGADEDQIKLARQVVMAHEGRLGADMSQKWQRRQDWTQTFLYWNILPFAAISSLMDPFMVTLRNDGDFKSAWQAANKAFQAMKAESSTLQELAEFLGVVAEQHTAHAIHDQVEFGTTSGSPNLWNERLFHFIGMHALTKFSRLMALSAGSDFIMKHAKIVKDKNGKHSLESGALDKQSQRYLDQLGISREEALNWFNRPPEQFGQPDPQEHPAMIQAMNQFVDESILRPDPSQRPYWASDPKFKLVFMLKGFMYSFSKTILTRVYTEMRDKIGDKGMSDPSVYMPLLYAGTALPVAMVSIMIKDAIKFSTSDQEPPERDWLDAWSRSGLMGPLEGLIDVRYGYESELPIVGSISPAFSFFADATTQQIDTTVSKSIPGISWTAGTRNWVQNL